MVYESLDSVYLAYMALVNWSLNSKLIHKKKKKKTPSHDQLLLIDISCQAWLHNLIFFNEARSGLTSLAKAGQVFLLFILAFSRMCSLCVRLVQEARVSVDVLVFGESCTSIGY